MKKILTIAICFLLLSACKSKTTKPFSKNQVPTIVDSLHAQDLYNEAKWWTYCINCDNTVNFYVDGKYIDTSITFGETSIHDRGTKIYNSDTVDFRFQFYYDTLKCYPGKKYKTFPTIGIQFKLSNKKPTAIITSGSLEYDVITGVPVQRNNRYFVPLQPEVINYISKNKDRLDPWFRNEAKRRMVIRE